MNEPMKHLIISCSLSPTSRSATIAGYLKESLSTHGGSVEILDLREYELPPCDGGASYSNDNVISLVKKIRGARSITLAVPIYNYDVGWSARNLIALTGQAWMEKVVGFIGAAGGERSYMSIMSLANALMLDFRSVIVPRYLYASKTDFPGGRPNEKMDGRIDALAADLHRFSAALMNSTAEGPTQLKDDLVVER